MIKTMKATEERELVKRRKKDMNVSLYKLFLYKTIYDRYQYNPFTFKDLRILFPDLNPVRIYDTVILVLERMNLIKKIPVSNTEDMRQRYVYQLVPIEEKLGITLEDIDKLFKLIQTKERIDEMIEEISSKLKGNKKLILNIKPMKKKNQI